jgi:hypothetical protein
MPSHKCKVCSKVCNERNAVMVLRPHRFSFEVDDMTMIWLVKWEEGAARYYDHVHARSCLQKWLARRVPELRSARYFATPPWEHVPDSRRLLLKQ